MDIGDGVGRTDADTMVDREGIRQCHESRKLISERLNWSLTPVRKQDNAVYGTRLCTGIGVVGRGSRGEVGKESVIPAPVRRLGGGQEITAIVSNSATALEFGSVPSISTLCIHRLPYVWSKYKQPYNPVFHRSS